MITLFILFFFYFFLLELFFKTFQSWQFFKTLCVELAVFQNFPKLPAPHKVSKNGQLQTQSLKNSQLYTRFQKTASSTKFRKTASPGKFLWSWLFFKTFRSWLFFETLWSWQFLKTLCVELAVF